MIICVDFDGTLCEHKYPDIGEALPDAFYWLGQWRSAGARLILYTMRSDGPGERRSLSEAKDWCFLRHGFMFDNYNVNPQQAVWTSSPKVYAHLYVDDAAFGCPLIRTPGKRPVVDWSVVGPGVMQHIRTGC
jgi:hypothetical protein